MGCTGGDDDNLRPLLMLAVGSEAAGHPWLAALGADQTISDVAPGGNMEGKGDQPGLDC